MSYLSQLAAGRAIWGYVCTDTVRKWKVGPTRWRNAVDDVMHRILTLLTFKVFFRCPICGKNVPFSSSASQLHDKPSTTKGSDRLFLKRRFKTTIQIKYYVYVISTIILLSHLVACMYYHRRVCQVAAKWRCFRIIKGRNDKPSLFLLKDVAATKCRLAIYEEISFPGQPTTKFQPSHVMYEQRNTFHEESRFNHSVKTNDNLKEHCRDDVVDAIKHLNYRAGTSVLSDWQCVV